jgi:glycosyltransferase involved in cell wall biosynthesis
MSTPAPRAASDRSAGPPSAPQPALRVLHLVSIPQLTGAAEPTLDMVRGLAGLGVAVELRIDTKLDGNLRSILTAAGEPVDDALVLSARSNPLELARDLSRLRALLPRFDLVHVHLSHDHALAWTTLRSLPRRARPALVRTVHAERVLGPNAFRRLALREAAGLTVAARDHGDRLVREHGVAPERILELAGSVDPDRFHPDDDARARVRAELGLPDAAFVIASVARFKAGRRHELVLDAFAAARREAPELRLMLIGHGELQPALEARAAADDLAGAVLFPGYKREDLNDYLVAGDALIWITPGNDASCRAVLQAMAAGRPVLGSRLGSIPSMVEDRVTGALADADDVADLTRAMLALARDPARSRALGEAGRARALERYGRRARAERLLAFYRRILEQP